MPPQGEGGLRGEASHMQVQRKREGKEHIKSGWCVTAAARQTGRQRRRTRRGRELLGKNSGEEYEDEL